MIHFICQPCLWMKNQMYWLWSKNTLILILIWSSIFVLTVLIVLIGILNIHHYGNSCFWSTSFFHQQYISSVKTPPVLKIFFLRLIQSHVSLLIYMTLFTWKRLGLCFFFFLWRASTMNGSIKISCIFTL